MKSLLINSNEKPHVSISVVEDTQYIISPTSLNLNLELIFEKSDISAEIIFLGKLGGSEENSIVTTTDHRVPRTSCNTFVKNVLMDSSKSKYVGKILIKKLAQQTTSFLQTNTLVIGDKTSNNSQPILEIEADDVKASHGSTTGRVDSSMVYYLQSRGFSKQEAESLIVEGYFAETLNKIYDPTIRKEVAETLGIIL